MTEYIAQSKETDGVSYSITVEQASDPYGIDYSTYHGHYVRIGETIVGLMEREVVEFEMEDSPHVMVECPTEDYHEGHEITGIIDYDGGIKPVTVVETEMIARYDE